ncbi:MAG: hypothetical protein FWE98_04785 [Oscillospiraceae bacterium]|nr:hypothetical protein [Oscillospiraceae bacterium]
MKKLCSILLALCITASFAAFTAIPAAAEVNPYEPPANLDQLTQAQQLAYFNLVVNRVRAERPGFQSRELVQIAGFRSSLAEGAMDGLINEVVKQLMPAEWRLRTFETAQSNQGWFFSENVNASDLRLEDILSINSKKDGDNWIIELLIPEETNPGKGLSSAHARIGPVATREEVVADLTEAGMLLSVSNATLRYHNGFARVTVNDQGQVIAGANGFQVLVLAYNARIAIFSFDIAALQNAEFQYAHFTWAPEEGFPEANFDVDGVSIPPIPPLTWWQRLPSLFQFILRWFFFGWLWMR